MDLEPQINPLPEAPEFAEVPDRKPLELLRNTEALLRRQTVATLVPVLPSAVATRLQDASAKADTSLYQLAEINLNQISDQELQPARILIGLSFVGLSALLILFLLLYLNTIHPELSRVEQIRNYWYQYVGFVCLGVAGMFMLGREAMRPNLDVISQQDSISEVTTHEPE
ncbi:MAG TPA: hypothetical protein V6D15_12105 [Oculatellaceae cyanobacterium]|jgi:hypothetical protein